MRSDGQPDLYMNCIIGLVHKWFGDDMPKKLFASWAGDARQTMYDDLAWLALENAVYKKRAARASRTGWTAARACLCFFASEYRLSRQEWMAKKPACVRRPVRAVEIRSGTEAACAGAVGKRPVGGACLPRHAERRGTCGRDLRGLSEIPAL